jgi:SAM-dependent methyltransferase
MSITGDTGLQTTVLETLASAQRYNDWLADLAWPYLGERPLEVGSGTGEYAGRWLARGLSQIIVTEGDESRLVGLKQRFADDPRVTVARLLLPEHADYGASAVVAYNVLEHIPDDRAAVISAAKCVRPGGHLVFFVPAFEFAMSRFDRMVGHQRRYTVDGMTTVLREAGVEPVSVSYINRIGLLAWVVGMKWLRQVPKDGVALRAWDRAAVPLCRRLDERFPPRFGQSVIAVARVP